MNDEIAAKHRIILCDFCECPQALHAGFDHGRCRCLIDWPGLSLMANGLLTKDEKDDLVRRLRMYYAEVTAAEETDMSIGDGI